MNGHSTFGMRYGPARLLLDKAAILLHHMTYISWPHIIRATYLHTHTVDAIVGLAQARPQSL